MFDNLLKKDPFNLATYGELTVPSGGTSSLLQSASFFLLPAPILLLAINLGREGKERERSPGKEEGGFSLLLSLLCQKKILFFPPATSPQKKKFRINIGDLSNEPELCGGPEVFWFLPQVEILVPLRPNFSNFCLELLSQFYYYSFKTPVFIPQVSEQGPVLLVFSLGKPGEAKV